MYLLTYKEWSVCDEMWYFQQQVFADLQSVEDGLIPLHVRNLDEDTIVSYLSEKKCTDMTLYECRPMDSLAAAAVITTALSKAQQTYEEFFKQYQDSEKKRNVEERKRAELVQLKALIAKYGVPALL